LAGRSASAPGIVIDGQVTIDGVDVNPVAYRKNIAYVMQDDALMATSTPREALKFSASLRLSGISNEEIDELVVDTLKALGILECADVFIGNVMIKGISGGQRKRTSVGVELITNPSLLLLDGERSITHHPMRLWFE
jgi:ATP-binding cassette, subfamily G (WHITE), eye pigment precursor transporter